MSSAMLQPTVLVMTHAVGYKVVTGDVVLSQMLFVVQIVFIVAQMATLARHHNAREILKLLSK